MNLKQYAWNIFEIAKANNEDLGVARRMLVNNIQQGMAINGGAELDYPALRRRWDAMDGKAQEAALEELNKYITDFSANAPYHSLCEAFERGDREAFDKVLAK
ncbi:hypothetical protein KQI82_06340 [Oscillibacter sp. MSJ-2]|uniref:Uncharacterized protein n=1 Tax=Dysosmobacter acutus TaxID=2841504 RepID=A0ABS6F8B7_9FIRM|nr:hypothetical protein [Dysosmobacter acutus]MBU5626538.1 hypothetical protein [Dysosmobacter acutus]